MASIILNFEANVDRSRESKRKKRRRIEAVDQDHSSSSSSGKEDQIRWRSVTEQQSYSSKLAEALRHVRGRTSTAVPSTITTRTRAVRQTADRVLAIVSRGRTRWSRAILTSRHKQRLKNHKKAKAAAKSKLASSPAAVVNSRLKSPAVCERNKKSPALQRRVRVLGRLVPGCRKLSFPNLLEEAIDYIPALEMQVRALAALAELLTGSPPAASAESPNRLGMS